MNAFPCSMKYIGMACLMFLLFSEWSSYAQGSSDPGLSTVGSLGMLHSQQILADTTQKRNLMRITQSAAMGEGDIFIVTSYLDVYLQINPKIQFQIRGPIHMARTKEARTVSIGDIFLMYTYEVIHENGHHLLANAGVRLPTNQSNLGYDNATLPMYYQTSIGSFEAIMSFEYLLRQRSGILSVSAGYQQPFFYINKNTLPESRELHRKSDVMLKSNYLFAIGKKFHAGAGAWWIYHTAEDSRLDLNGQRQGIPGSRGSTVNLTAAVQWLPAKNIEFGCSFGIPLVDRNIHPDGLYRQFVLNPHFQLRL